MCVCVFVYLDVGSLMCVYCYLLTFIFTVVSLKYNSRELFVIK